MIQSDNNKIYRFVLTFVLLCPYFIFYRMDHKDTPFWQDMIFAAIAFGLGYAVFPDKRPSPKQEPKPKDKEIIDQE